MGNRFIVSGAMAWVAMVASPGVAQIVVQGQGVADRPRPDYDPIGTPLGSFRLYPSVTVTGEATDNYLATDTDRRGDVYASITPEVDLRKTGGRQQVEARAYFSQSLHASLSGENAASGGASVSTAFEPSHDTQLRADASAAHFVESRASLGAFQAAAEPVRFETYHGGLGITHSFVDLSLSANGSIDRYDYHDTRLGDGTPIDQDYRDVRVATLSGSAQYALRNGIGLIATGSYVDEHYDNRPSVVGPSGGISTIDRDSSGFNLVGGVTLELSKLIFGSVQVGYLTRHYQDPSLYNFGGLSFSADVLWNVTPLTSIRFRASRSVQDTSSAFIASNTRSDFRISVDHELFRYIILSGDVSYGHFRPNGPGIGGDEYYGGVSARYLISRRYSITGSLRHGGRSSDSQFLRYQANYATLSFRAAF